MMRENNKTRADSTVVAIFLENAVQSRLVPSRYYGCGECWLTLVKVDTNEFLYTERILYRYCCKACAP